MDLKKKSFLDRVKKAQVKRFLKAGFSEDESMKLWKKERKIYLSAWKEYVAIGLVSFPNDLGEISYRDIDSYIRESG